MALHSDLEAINLADDQTAAALILPFIERAPSLAMRIAKDRPFEHAEMLADQIAAAVHSLDDAAAIELFLGHPELAPADPGAMTDASQSEQGRLALNMPNCATTALAELNAAYRERFGFPFIIALHEHSNLASVLSAFRQRCQSSKAEEIIENKQQICLVSRARVLGRFVPENEVAS